MESSEAPKAVIDIETGGVGVDLDIVDLPTNDTPPPKKMRGVRISSAKDPADLERRWRRFANQQRFKFYGVLLARAEDTEAAAFYEQDRETLANVSGEDYGFIYFRDLKRMRAHKPFEFAEHAAWCYAFARIIGCKASYMPCFVFFERLGVGEYTAIQLKDKSREQMLDLLDLLFDYLREHAHDPPHALLKGYHGTVQWKATEGVVERGIKAALKALPGAILTLLPSFIK